MNLKCPRCQTHVAAPVGGVLTCPTCGFSAPAPVRDAWRPVSEGPAPAPGGYGQNTGWGPASNAYQQQGKPKPTMGIAIAALLINALFMPGLGSIIGGRINEGIWQLVLTVGATVLAILLFFTIVGILLMPLVFLAPLAGWIWGIVTGVQLVQEAG